MYSTSTQRVSFVSNDKIDISIHNFKWYTRNAVAEMIRNEGCISLLVGVFELEKSTGTKWDIPFGKSENFSNASFEIQNGSSSHRQ